ncbi:uncharacterized protein [Typha latifolia]|uniref:uncharacterized protein n=1 Tax=Typha latifolia TaxID=4733 RepID=UPI003C2B96C0
MAQCSVRAETVNFDSLMAESEKGPVSSANVKKKSASFDEDFGEDFLIPWKSSKLGKDAIDFDVGAVSRNGKKIYFDKLDDFELGGDFDKISSFKMDMSDLDLSSPLKKTEKPNETSCKELVLGKKEPRKENFSFTFDFNELSMFGLDPKLVTKENEVSKPMDDVRTGGSVKHDKDLLSRSNSVIKIDIVESDQMHTLPKKASMDTSRPTHLIEQDTVRSDDPSTSSNLSCDDMCREAHISPDRHTPMTEENAEDKRFSEMHGKTADDSLPARQFSEKTAQDFSLLSVSCDDLVQPTLPNMHKVVSTSEPGKANLGREQDNCMRSIASSQSRNSSPVNSYHSRGWQSAYKSESASISNEFQKDERNKRQIGRSGSLESTEHREDLANTSAREFSHGISRGTKNEGEKQNSNPKLLPSPLHREARQSDEQAENKNKGLLMSINKPAKQGAPDVIRTERTESKNLSSRTRFQSQMLLTR